MTFTADKLRDSNMGKLRGYDFYRAIGSPRRIVAPMVRYMDQLHTTDSHANLLKLLYSTCCHCVISC